MNMDGTAGRQTPQSVEPDESSRQGHTPQVYEHVPEEVAGGMAQFPRENPNPVFRCAGDGSVLYANSPAERLISDMGWAAEGLIGEPLLDEVRHVLDEGTNHEMELGCSQERTFLFALSPSSTEGYVNLYGHDITGRKRAEAALIDTNRRLELLSDTAGRLLLTDNPQGLVQDLCEKVMAYLSCQLFFNFLVDDDRDCLRLNAYAGIPDETARSIDWLEYGAAVCGCVARDRARIVAEDIPNTPDPRTDLVKSYGVQAYACHPLLAQGGRAIGTLSFGSRTKPRFTDDELSLMKIISDQVATAMERIRLLDSERQHAEARRVSEERLRLAIESADMGTWDLDLLSGRHEWSRRCVEMLGLQPGTELTGSLVESLAHPDDLGILQATMRSGLREDTARAHDAEFRMVRPDGSIRWMAAKGRAFFAEVDGVRRAVRVTGTLLDITDRKLAEQREHELQAQQRDFYRRTILAATNGKLEVMQREDLMEFAGEPLQTWRMADLAELAWLREEVTDLAAAQGLLGPRLEDFSGCAAEALTNAVKHADGGAVSLHRRNGRLLFLVCDNGPGIGSLNLPDVALTMGYSTAGTGGFGYKLIIACADKTYLSTGPEGTAVAVEMALGVQSDEQ